MPGWHNNAATPFDPGFVRLMVMMDLILLSAGSGLGKTTFLCDQLARLAAEGRSVGGVVSPAVFEQGRRIGYDLLDLRTGNRRLLARAVGPDSAAATVGVYRFDDQAMAAGNAAIIAAVQDGLEIIAVDEVGPLEMRGGGWTPALEFALQKCLPGQHLVVTVRPTLADKLPERFPAPIWTAQTRIAPPWPASLGV
jgi:nucleoside-triphosphatase THEP1